MSTQNAHTAPEPGAAGRAQMATMILTLMPRAGLRTVADLARAMAHVMADTTLYNRMNCSADWQADELRELAAVLQVPPAAFFDDPRGLSGQNWKKISRPDLRIVDGGGETDRRLGALRLV